MNEPLRKQISELLATRRVVLFMKGDRKMRMRCMRCVLHMSKFAPHSLIHAAARQPSNVDRANS
jgi:glutaredoxin-related protein